MSIHRCWPRAGAILITVGILLASGGLAALRHAHNHEGLFWGVATGCMIACYTLVDGYSVKTLLISPFLVDYAGNLFRTVSFLAEHTAVVLHSCRNIPNAGKKRQGSLC